MRTELRRRLGQLTQRWQTWLQGRQQRWLDRRVPASDNITLSQRTIFILPTGRGAVLAAGALVVLILAVAERNLVALSIAILLLSLFLLSLVLCYRNLSGLRLSATETMQGLPRQRCFVGDSVPCQLRLSSANTRRHRFDISLGFSKQDQQLISVPAADSIALTLQHSAGQRGLLSAPRLMLSTDYPAGLWRAWSRPDLAMRVLVYPKPLACTLPANARQWHTAVTGQQQAARRSGVDDFVGLRVYQSGDSRRRIAWQSLAKGQGLRSKHFVREADPPVMLDWAQFSGHDAEQVLRCLSYQVLSLSKRQQQVGLRLPGVAPVPPGQGEAHKHRLLQALALWGTAP